MGTDTPSGGQQSGTVGQANAVFHGFYTEWGEEEIDDMRECTLFITDDQLVLGDTGEYEVLGGLPDVLPDPAEGIVRNIFAPDDGETIDYETAEKRHDSEVYDLDEISEIEVEKSMPPAAKQMVEIEHTYGTDVSIFIGTGKNHGGEQQTQEFVDTLETAAKEAGGTPRVTSEFDL